MRMEIKEDAWMDLSPYSPEPPSASVLEAAHNLRMECILSFKEELELVFAQECRTYAFAANALLTLDPSMEADVARALHTCLQKIEDKHIQELRHFIAYYDMVYAQECWNYGFVANTLLTLDPSMEADVARALHTCLQKIEDKHVQELRSFITYYDMVTS